MAIPSLRLGDLPTSAPGEQPWWQTVQARLMRPRPAAGTARPAADGQPLATGPMSIPIDSLNQAVMIADASARLVAVNPAFSAITGYAAHEVLQRNPRLLKSDRHGDAFYADLWARLMRDGAWQGEVWNRRKDGTLFPAWQTISVQRLGDGSIEGYVSVFSDISVLKLAEAQLRHLAHHDPLTGLPNRLLFTSELERSMHRAQRHDQKLALLFIDLDGFKAVNDQFGHLAGDQLLRMVAARLRDGVRGQDAVARLGGDEFTVLLEEIDSAEAAADAAHKLHALIAQPVMLGPQLVSVSASIGIALYPDDGRDAGALIQVADEAMYLGKRRCRPAGPVPH